MAINDKKYRFCQVYRRYPTEYGLLSDFFASLSAPLLIRRSRKTNFRRIIQRNFSPPTLDRRVSRHSPCFRSLVPSRQSTMRLLGGIRVPLSHCMPSGPVEISVNFSTHPMGGLGFFVCFGISCRGGKNSAEQTHLVFPASFWPTPGPCGKPSKQTQFVQIPYWWAFGAIAKQCYVWSALPQSAVNTQI